MYKSLIRPALLAYAGGDAEEAHELTLRAMVRAQESHTLLRMLAWWFKANKNIQTYGPYKLGNVTFKNRIGLAAGLDKNAVALPFWQALGFGFVEIGTVLPRPQTGNPRPRLFGLPKHGTIINRMGFNSDGSVQVAKNLKRLRRRVQIPIGGSVSKMKETPLEHAAQDCLKALEDLWQYIDFAVVNVSSPNTPELRQLQDVKYIENLLLEITAGITRLGKKPFLVKISPDLTQAELMDILEATTRCEVDGLVVSNTTISRPKCVQHLQHSAEIGGLSGPPVYPLMKQLVTWVREVDTKIPIVAAGGIDHPDKINELNGLGVNMFQILTGLVMQGPSLIPRLRRAF